MEFLCTLFGTYFEALEEKSSLNRLAIITGTGAKA